MSVTCLIPSTILSVYTNDVTLIQASIPSLYVISGALLIGAVANIVFNGVTGTGNTRSAFVMELATLVFYTLFIYVVGMRLHMPVAICFMTEVVYYTGLLVRKCHLFKESILGKIRKSDSEFVIFSLFVSFSYLCLSFEE